MTKYRLSESSIHIYSLDRKRLVRILRDPNFNTLFPFCLAPSPTTYNPTDLKRGIGILHELGEVRLQIRQYHTINRISSGHSYLEPSASFRCRLKSIAISTVGVIAGRAGIRGTITFTTGLYPDKGIGQSVTSLGSWSNTEAGSLDIAPITPSTL